MKKPKLKKNDVVIVIAGRERGRQGKSSRFSRRRSASSWRRSNDQAAHPPEPVEELAGGISEKEAPIHISNVMLVDPTRTPERGSGGGGTPTAKPERFAKKSGAALA